MLARGQAATEKLQAAPLKNLRYFSLQLQPDRHPGRLGDGAQRGRRGSRVTAWTQLQRSPFLGSCIPTPPPKALVHGGNQTHTHKRVLRRLTELTLQKRRELRTFVLKRLRLYLGHNQGLRLLHLSLVALLSTFSFYRVTLGTLDTTFLNCWFEL